jgi:signal transduction histidine kinase
VRIWVRDTGVGIDPEAQARLFDRFFRVDTRETRAVGGTGLGLTIARHLVELHGGTIAVESMAGCGSTSTVTLPVAWEAFAHDRP